MARLLANVRRTAHSDGSTTRLTQTVGLGARQSERVWNWQPATSEPRWWLLDRATWRTTKETRRRARLKGGYRLGSRERTTRHDGDADDGWLGYGWLATVMLTGMETPRTNGLWRRSRSTMIVWRRKCEDAWQRWAAAQRGWLGFLRFVKIGFCEGDDE